MAKKPTPASAKVTLTFVGDTLLPVLDKKNDPRMSGALFYLLKSEKTIVHLFEMLKEQQGDQALDEAIGVFEQLAQLEALKEIEDTAWQYPLIPKANQLGRVRDIDDTDEDDMEGEQV